MYGKYFKELRQKRNLSIRQVAGDIISPSTLSRWENDEITPNFNTVISLLHQIRVSPQEFVNYTQIHYPYEEVKKINQAYINKDITSLKKLFNQAIQKYQENHSIHSLFVSAIAASWYCELTKTNLLPDIYIKKLTAALSGVTYWSQYYSGVLGNTIFLLSNKFAYGLTNLIINDLDEISKSGTDALLVSWTTILNAFAKLMKDNSSYSEKLYKRLQKIAVPSFLVSIRFRKQFLEELFKYQTTQKSEENLYHMIEATKSLGLEEYYSDFYSLFIEIQAKLKH